MYAFNSYKAYNALKKVGKVVEAKEAKAAYNEAKRVAKRVVWLAKSEDQSINQSIWRIFIAPLKIKFHRGASTRRHNHTGTILNDI